MGHVDINAKEESTLLGASFEPLAENDGILWEKNGVCYSTVVKVRNLGVCNRIHLGAYRNKS